MPKGPQGQKRPADVIGNAIRVARIATGEEQDDIVDVASTKSDAGKLGGKARSAALNPERRREIASKAAKSRWEVQAQPVSKAPKKTTAE